MRLSPEQEAVVAVQDPLVLVNAFAGAGKTSTIMEYIKARKKKRILTLVFNRSASEDMQKKAQKNGISTAEFSTIHAFAYRNSKKVFPGLLDRLQAKLQPQDLAKFFERKLVPDKKRRYVAAKILSDVFTDFIKSQAKNLKSYFDGGWPGKTAQTMKKMGIPENRIEECLFAMEKDLLDDHGKLPITHDGYLKRWQLYCEHIDLGFDEIIVDEAQDTTNCTLALVLGQKRAKQRFVGDRFQQIYGWNGCINSFPKLEQMGATSLALTQSFRCPDRIAILARPYLALLGAKLTFRGCSTEMPDDGKKAILCRTNAAVINTLFHLRETGFPSRKICLYGGVQSYNFNDVFDIANLALKRKDKILSPEVKSFASFEEYREYVDEIEDYTSKKNCELIAKFGPKGIFALRGFLTHEPYSDTPVADGIIVSTAHKSKGSEFGSVELATDFLTISEYLAIGDKENIISFEDLRILYVAITRAKCSFSPLSRDRYALTPQILQAFWELLQQGKIKMQDVGERGTMVDASIETVQGLETYATHH